MGGAVSAGETNDELIDNLVDANYIESYDIEEIFRAVDRGAYYLKEYRETAYHDLAWKHNHIHISAPCIYAKVMSNLELRPGLSFLNIGSGTGYLSTLVGLTLGCNGINHGIELHEDVAEYAREKVSQFILQSHAFDRYVFCEPEFVVGNCIHLSPDTPGYDRIYCGAACPSEYEMFMKNLLNINGILILPLNDQLQVIKRTSTTEWTSKGILTVNFASLILPSSNDDANNLSCPLLPPRNPPSLSAICRACIRQVLSRSFHSSSNRRYRRRSSSDSLGLREGRRRLNERRNVITDSSSSSDDDDMNEIPLLSRSTSDLPDLISDDGLVSDDTDDDESTEDDEVGTKRSSILNVATGTVTTIGDSDEEKTKKENNTSSTTTNETSAAAAPIPSSKTKNNEPDSPKTNKRGGNKRNDCERDPSSGKLKRSRRDWTFIKQMKKNRKTERSVLSSPEQTETDSDANNRETVRNMARTADPHSSPNEDDLDDSLHRYTSVVHLRSRAVSLRSFLVGMTTQVSSTLGSESRRRSSRVLEFISNTGRRGEERSQASAEILDDDEIYSYRELELPPDEFGSAILSLPVPDAIKQYLLYYRKPLD